MRLLVMFFLGSFLFLYAQNETEAQDTNKQGLIETQSQNNHELSVTSKQDVAHVEQSKSVDKGVPDLSFLSLYEHADIVVKFVIYILLAFSIITWGVFIAKIVDYNRAFRKIKNEQKKLSTLKYFKEIELAGNGYTHEIAKEVSDESQYIDNAESLKNRIRLRVENKITQFSASIKHGVPILASVGSSAPFIGLFGTVWGIMNSFIGIATQNNASLSVVAPGIAEALFATAFGLIAAIPAVLFYNYFVRLGVKFTNQISQMATQIYILNERERLLKD